MSEIKKGDLVMVVRTCCDLPLKEGVRMGLPWRVQVVAQLNVTRCPQCGFADTGRYASSKEIQRSGWNCAPIEWLKKIDPPAETEGVDEREPIEMHRD